MSVTRKYSKARSSAALKALSKVEVGQVMDFTSDFPVVIEKASGAAVIDVDGNRYLDMTSFFGAALVGHRNPVVLGAIRRQLGRLLHGMGDVHPPAVKAKFLSKLAKRMPAPDYKGLLSLNGSDAVETALKFAAAATKKAGIIAFEGAYHGLTGGALEVTWNPVFRSQFQSTLAGRGRFVLYPTDHETAAKVLEKVEQIASSGEVGAIIIEPILGRGGIKVPPPGFLSDLAKLAARHNLVFITDEIYCGAGRTGTYLASDIEGLAPDVICLGKALGGGMPLSACMMRPWVADAVHGASHEAVHTSTFLGHPIACAAGLGVMQALDKGLAGRAAQIGGLITNKAQEWQQKYPVVLEIRGRGAMIGIEMAPGVASQVVAIALRKGVMVLTEGVSNETLALMPPLVITDRELNRALNIIESAIVESQKSLIIT